MLSNRSSSRGRSRSPRCRHSATGIGEVSDPIPDQFGSNIDPANDLSNREFVSLDAPDDNQIDNVESIRIAYAHYGEEDIEDYENPRDALHQDRVLETSDRSGDDWEHTVVTEIQQGDRFTFEYYAGTWEFIGVHELYDRVMLFRPVDAAARNAPVYKDIKTVYRGDFVRKFSAALTSSIQRIEPSEE